MKDSYSDLPTSLINKFPCLPAWRLLTASFICGVAGLLVACGGGSGGSSNGSIFSGGNKDAWKAGVYKASSTFENYCAAPRTGASPITGIAFPDKNGSALQEKNFLRSWSYETYLWFEDLPDLNPDSSYSPQEYFLQLVSNKKTASGAYKDNFHWYEPTQDAEAWSAGITYGYGLNLKVIGSDIYVAYTDTGSPAAAKGVKRGARLISVDGLSASTITNALIDLLYPSNINAVHEFEFLESGAGATRKVILESASLETDSVTVAKVIESGGSKVGYLQFNTFIPAAQDKWINAINSMNSAGVSDLVLDLRYNGGGYISVAAQVGYMIAGTNTANKTFFQEVNNSKLPKELPWPFESTALYGTNKYLSLPSLNLQRVYVLSTEGTCSASELVINSLRGIGVSVYLIGDTTCGKPYGYTPTPNCGTTYYTIQLKSVNAQGFGEYSDGFIPSSVDNNQDKVRGCKVSDDLSHELGDPNEALLAAALQLRSTGTCPASASARSQKMSAAETEGEFIQPDVRKLLILDR